MKYLNYIILCLVLVAFSCGPASSSDSSHTGTTQAKAQPVSASSASTLPATMPFHFEVKATDMKLSKGVQSMAAGHSGQKWLFVGGRTNGFHLTFSDSRTFPTKFSNEDFIVFDAATGQSYTLAIPDAYKVRLRATNMEYHQDGNTLYTVGGYGSNCDADNNNCYVTMPYLTAIDVPRAIDAIISGNSTALASTINSIEDKRMAVTGGVLHKLGDKFYLVFGQDYVGKYKSGLNGTYTKNVAVFTIEGSGANMKIGEYQTYTDPNPPADGQFSQYRRRDLNVTEEIFGDGTYGLAVWGGVFTIDDGGWPNPIYIKPNGNNAPDITLQSNFTLKCNYYEAANLGLYDPSTGVMYTTIFGGISNYYYNAENQLVQGTGANSLPWVNIINTLAIASDGTKEFTQPATQVLPELIGANAEFFPAESLEVFRGASEIYDLSKITGERVLVGHIAAGIRSTANQTNGINPTFANDKIYEVYLVRNQE
jgi:hypothetical protein